MKRHQRQKNLFNHLKDAEEQYSFSKTNKATDPQDYSAIDKQTYRRIKKEMKQFRGKESIFKRNEANIRECLRARCVPDHAKNPQKWVYYSLADVTPDQMSESTNTATAFALIKKLEEEKESANTEMECNSENAIIFKKPTFQVSSVIKKPPSQIEKVIFKSSKVIMPEYVVGVSKKKEKKIPIKKSDQKDNTDRKLNLKLNHLYENEDEEI
ncbi:hypothetical protein K1T71_006021 [Dendrolimus kikuchii]|uniref:Uncharacterized protein n=1 Tax=Dendrolimus kikuchii TaxID=765133 RepID=A0ACC1D3N1_9NEOP|nr:hypothetical protein K1T71_006021 [Dendrolimus kikuchii]